tara:strand:- start:254 stop:1918 length:1665 start_codon:yes stop_codon:yes gene_type:complete
MAQHLKNETNLFDWKPDYNKLNEEIIAGPQREVLETIQDINRGLGTNMKVTKTFRFSPGFYDELKKGYFNKVYELNKRRQIPTFVNSQSNNDWIRRRMNDKLLRLDHLVKQRRANNVIFSDNANHAKEALNVIKAIIKNQLPALKEYPIEFEFKIGSLDYDRGIRASETPTHLFLLCKIDPYYLDYIVSDKLRYKIPMFKTEILYRMDLIRAITQIIGLLTSKKEDYCLSDDEIKRELGATCTAEVAGWYEGASKYGVLHPYISKREYWNNRSINIGEKHFTYACHGQFDVLYKFAQLKLDELAHYTLQWMSSFVNRHTNPLNNMNMAFNGYHMWMDNEFKDLHNTDPEACNIANREEDDDSYCKDTRCLNRNICSFYQKMNDTGISQAQQDWETIQNPDSETQPQPDVTPEIAAANTEPRPLEDVIENEEAPSGDDIDQMLHDELVNMANMQRDALTMAMDRIREINNDIVNDENAGDYRALVSRAIDATSEEYGISRDEIIELVNQSGVGSISNLVNDSINTQNMTNEERTLAFVARNGGQVINIQQTREER